MYPMLGATEGVVYDLGFITLERPGVLYVYITVYPKKFVGSFNLRLIFRHLS